MDTELGKITEGILGTMGKEIERQLSQENLVKIIESIVTPLVSNLIASQLSSFIEKTLQSLVKREIDMVTENCNRLIYQLYEAHMKNTDILKSLQFHLASKISSESLDPITQAFEKKDFAQAFEMFFALTNEERTAYIKVINFQEMNEDNISQDLAFKLAIWGIKCSQKVCVERMCIILKKGSQLSEVLRKIVASGDKELSDAKSFALKKSLT